MPASRPPATGAAPAGAGFGMVARTDGATCLTVDHAHFAGVAGAEGRVTASADAVDAPIAMPALLRPLAEHEAVAGGAW